MDRGRGGRRYGDDRPFGGEMYRPSERNAPPRPDYRSYRSPPRRGRTPPLFGDTYAPAADRRRSRSPAYKGEDGGSYRGRPRSPPRTYSPPRDFRARSPLTRTRRYSRSPMARPRSPPPSKRESSPYRKPRSPLAVKRDRISSPPRDTYRRRDYSPTKSLRLRYPNENNYRPGERSASPPRHSEHISQISSRRSSPHIHPERLAMTGSGPRSRAVLVERDRGYSKKSIPQRGYSSLPVSPPRETVAFRAPSSPREQTENWNGDMSATRSDARSGYRNGESRPPAHGRDSHARKSPSGPTPSAPFSMSAHNRPASGVLLSAPTRPRGGPAFTGRDSRDHPNSGSPYRGGRLPRQQHDSRSTPADQAPPGPRSFHRALPPFRSNNSSSTTYPRTQRFNTTNNTTNHLAVMPVIIPGGEALPSVIDPAAKKRLTELEEGRKKLLELIEEKQEEKRRGLRKWESKKREGRRDGLRSELAEGALEAMSGEGAGAGTAF